MRKTSEKVYGKEQKNIFAINFILFITHSSFPLNTRINAMKCANE